MTFTESQHQLLEVIAIVTGTVGSVGSLIIILSYLIFRKKLSMGQSSVVWMSIADFLNNVGFGIQYWSDNVVVCYMEAIMITIFELAAILWNVNIATFIVATIVFPTSKSIDRGDQKKTVKQWIKEYWWVPVFHLFAWGIPMLICAVALGTNVLGKAEPWCWVKDDLANPLVAQLIIFYVWLWSSIGYILLCYLLVLIKVVILYVSLRRKDVRAAKSEARRIFFSTGKLFLYPLVLILSYIPATISRIYQFATGNKSFALALLHSIFVHLLGVSNCVVFFTTQNILKHYVDCIRGIFRSRRTLAARERLPTSFSEDVDTHHDLDDEDIILDDTVGVKDTIQTNLDAIDIHSSDESEDDEYANQLPNMHYKDGPMKPII